MPEPYAFIDNIYKKASEAKISILEPTFTRGDSVYDTVSVLKNKIFRLSDHLDRFEKSCREMEIDVKYEKNEIARIAAKCVQMSEYSDAMFTLIGRRGPYSSLTSRDPRTCKNSLMVVAGPYYNIFGNDKNQTGLNACLVKNRRVSRDAIDARVKNFNWMDLNRGLLEAYKNGGDTAILCTSDGSLAEGPGFNLWIIKDGILKTPKGNVLEGITRKSVEEIAHKFGFEALELTLEAKDLEEADEAFTCTTAAGITPITHVDNKPLGNGYPGILTERILSEYWSAREDGWHSTEIESLI